VGAALPKALIGIAIYVDHRKIETIYAIYVDYIESMMVTDEKKDRICYIDYMDVYAAVYASCRSGPKNAAGHPQLASALRSVATTMTTRVATVALIRLPMTGDPYEKLSDALSERDPIKPREQTPLD
jgi:hypothetical protein